MPAPQWLARINRPVNRLIGPLAGHMPGFGVVVHRGRRSGRTYRTPVKLYPHRGGCAIALSFGPDSEWVRNVLAAGGCQLETDGRTLRMTEPRLVHDPQRRPLPAPIRRAFGLLNIDDFLELTPARKTRALSA